MRANQVMSRDVVTIPENASVYEAAFTLLNANISAAPVVDANGIVIGIVSESDLMRRPEIGTVPRRTLFDCLIADETVLARDYIRSHSRRVTDVMTRKVVTANAHTRLKEIARLMSEHGIKRIPIVLEGRPIGIVSRANLLQGLIARSPQESESTPADERLCTEVRESLNKRGWATSRTVNVVADHGVVHLWGFVDNDTVRKAYEVAAEGVKGVERVENHMMVLPLEAHLAI